MRFISSNLSDSRENTKQHVDRFSGAIFKGYSNRQLAESRFQYTLDRRATMENIRKYFHILLLRVVEVLIYLENTVRRVVYSSSFCFWFPGIFRGCHKVLRSHQLHPSRGGCHHSCFPGVMSRDL